MYKKNFWVKNLCMKNIWVKYMLKKNFWMKNLWMKNIWLNNMCKKKICMKNIKNLGPGSWIGTKFCIYIINIKW